MPKSKQKVILPIIALVLAQLLWGVNTPVIKLGLKTVPLPLYLSVTVIGAGLLVGLFTYRSWKSMKLKDLAVLIIASLIAITLGNVVLLMGLRSVPAINAALIGLFSPFLLFILSVEFLKERLSVRTFIGILIAFMGAVVIIGKPWQSAEANQTVITGNLLIVLAALCDVTEMVMIKPVLKRVNPYQVTTINLVLGTLPVGIYALRYLHYLSPSLAGRNGYLAMGFNILAVAGANCLFFYGLKHKQLGEIGIFQYIHPLATAIAAWFILVEVPDGKVILGAALIFGGIYMAEKKNIAKIRRRYVNTAR